MRVVLLVLLIGCGAATPAPRPPAAATAAAPRPHAPPSEAEVKRMSHAVLDAWDHGDVAAFEAALAPELVHFESGKPHDRADELAKLRKRKPTTPTIASRTWSDEHVDARPDDAVFIGKAAEVQGSNTKKGGYRFSGWYVLHWVRRGDAWQLRLWTWHRADDGSARDTWNEMFRNGVGFKHEPNRLLVDTVRGVRPGKALDVAMGQGRNALYLASQGWQVTGVDLSDEGIRQARAEADQRGLTLRTVNTNIDGYDFGVNQWDLVTMIYAGSDVKWIEKIKPSLRKGGLFVVEYFAADPDEGKHGDGGFARGQLAKLFADGFDVLRDDYLDDEPDWALDRAKLVRFVARKK